MMNVNGNDQSAATLLHQSRDMYQAIQQKGYSLVRNGGRDKTNKQEEKSHDEEVPAFPRDGIGQIIDIQV